MNFAKELKYIRISNNILQKDLAKKIDASQSYISKLEKGIIEPSLDMLVKIADALQTSVDYLLSREDEASIITIQNELSPDEQKLIDGYNKLNKYAQERLLAYLEGLLDNKLSQKNII